MFVVLKNADGKTEVVTPPLQDIILPGVTRDSILSLLRDHAAGKITLDGLPREIVISEREIGMKEVEDAQKDGRLLEMFGSGTAALVSPVDKCVSPLSFTTPSLAIVADLNSLSPLFLVASASRDATSPSQPDPRDSARSPRPCSTGSCPSRWARRPTRTGPSSPSSKKNRAQTLSIWRGKLGELYCGGLRGRTLET